MARIDIIDPDEADPWRRRRRILRNTGLLVVTAIVGFAVVAVISKRNDDEAQPVVTDAVVVTDPTEPPPEPQPFEPRPVDPLAFPDMGSDYIGEPLELLSERKVGEVTVRAQVVTWDGMEEQFAPVGEPQGWVAAAWCWPTNRSLRVTMQRGDSVSTAQMPFLDEARPPLTAALMVPGEADGTPYRVVAVLTAPGVASVAVRFPEGGSDEAKVDNGVALLTVPGGQVGRFVLSVVAADGTVNEMPSTEIPREGDEAWNDACTPPPPELPPPGVQPGNVAANTAEIETLVAEMQAVLRQEIPLDEGLFFDTEVAASSLQMLIDSGLAELGRQVLVTVEELVFTSPQQAWFRYRMALPGIGEPMGQALFGIAELRDGRWLLDERIWCSISPMGCAQDGPIQPPAG